MTQKEKAIELVDKFKDYVNGYVGSSMLTNYEYPEQILLQAKKVAIICVDEIINSSPSAPILSDAGSFVNDIEESTEWWKEVKQEIKNYEGKD